MKPIQADIDQAAAQLGLSERGRRIKADLYHFVSGAFAAADLHNRDACVTLLTVTRYGAVAEVLDATRPSDETEVLDTPSSQTEADIETLKAIEWAGHTDAEEGGYVPACPFCDAERGNGHHSGCRLAALIERTEGRAS